MVDEAHSGNVVAVQEDALAASVVPPWGRWAVNFKVEARCFHVIVQPLLQSEIRSET